MRIRFLRLFKTQRLNKLLKGLKNAIIAKERYRSVVGNVIDFPLFAVGIALSGNMGHHFIENVWLLSSCPLICLS